MPFGFLCVNLGKAHLGVLRVLLASTRSSSHAGDMESGAPANPPSSERRDYRKRIWFSALVHRLRDRFESLIREHASAGRLGVAVAVGVLIGCTPFLGFQVLLVVAIATLFKLNRIAVLLGVQVSTPPITPLLLFANAQVGALLLHRHWLPISLEAVRSTPKTKWVLDLFLELLAGGLVVGGVLALGLGGVTAYFVQRHRAQKRLSEHLPSGELQRLESKLEKLPKRWRSYARWKLRLDPVYPLILAALPRDVHLVDLGSGIGLLPYLVAISRPGARIDAVEWDGRKIELASKLLEELPSVRIHEKDARQYSLANPEALTLIDVLHYSSCAEQRVWLSRCAQALRPGGLLIIRELDTSRTRRPYSVRLEQLAVRFAWNRGAGVEVWSPVEMANDLTALGFTVVVQSAGAGVFRGNALVIARKPGAQRLDGC
jgi:uncharacterized protein (DUF2062 family)/2-polyprenyl-3-methyl-5-hydroxy-6-metoxy-1,4-benzoquinol methylase